MKDWNVVVTVRQVNFPAACQSLEEFGSVARTHYFNVLTLQVDDIKTFAEQMRERTAQQPALLEFFGHIIPVTHTFHFQTPELFETQACETVKAWLPFLAGKSFHVRMHRCGFKGRLSSKDEERFLDRYLLDKLEERGSSGHISFLEPDYIIALETIDQRAGLSLWSREERERYAFLQLD